MTDFNAEQMYCCFITYHVIVTVKFYVTCNSNHR